MRRGASKPNGTRAAVSVDESVAILALHVPRSNVDSWQRYAGHRKSSIRCKTRWKQKNIVASKQSSRRGQSVSASLPYEKPKEWEG